jgi:hypothetical protein
MAEFLDQRDMSAPDHKLIGASYIGPTTVRPPKPTVFPHTKTGSSIAFRRFPIEQIALPPKELGFLVGAGASVAGHPGGEVGDGATGSGQFVGAHSVGEGAQFSDRVGRVAACDDVEAQHGPALRILGFFGFTAQVPPCEPVGLPLDGGRQRGASMAGLAHGQRSMSSPGLCSSGSGVAENAAR